MSDQGSRRDEQDINDENASEDVSENASENAIEDASEDASENESEYEEIDLTENPLYQVLSAFFENEHGENICDHLAKLTLAVENNTKMMAKLLKK